MIKNEKLLDFMKKELPSANIYLALKRFENEIFELHNSGYAIHQIVRYLKMTYDLKISRQTLSSYIKKEKTNNGGL